VIPETPCFEQVSNPVLLGDGRHWPLGAKHKQILQARPEGVVLEEGKEDFFFFKSGPITHGGFCLHLQCLFDVQIEAFQDKGKIFSAASVVISKVNSVATRHGLYILVIN
jgi:hypothetical protein